MCNVFLPVALCTCESLLSSNKRNPHHTTYKHRDNNEPSNIRIKVLHLEATTIDFRDEPVSKHSESIHFRSYES